MGSDWPKESSVRWGSRHPMGSGNFEGGRAAHCKVKGCFAMSFAKTAEPFEMLFGIWTLTVPRNHVLHGV